MRGTWWIGVMTIAMGCTDAPVERTTAPATVGTAVAVLDTVVEATTRPTGMASAMESATLSTKLMASVTAVPVVEGALVRRGDVLVRLDVQDLAAKRRQIEAGLSDAEAQRDLAMVHATRMRAMLADSAAPRAMVDRAEADLQRAEAGVRAVGAQLDELAATTGYGELRAPFDGVIAQRHVDVGAFVAPGTPLITVDRVGALRVTVTIPADQAGAVRAGMAVVVEIEGDTTTAKVEGVARGVAGTYLVNAIVANTDARFRSGSSATLRLPAGTRRAMLVPTAALRGDGDLVTVVRRTPGGDLVTMVRTGEVIGDQTEVLGGVVSTDSVVVPGPTGSR